MGRPRTKRELLDLSEWNFEKLNELVDSYSNGVQLAEFPPGTMNRNIRDILAHLHHWHILFQEWYKAGMAGKQPEMPAKGFTWATVPALNKVIWNTYHEHELDHVRRMLGKSFNQVRALINAHSNEELFTKQQYGWTGSTSLGSYLVSTTSSHYDWAYKLIRKAKRGSLRRITSSA
ncbi:MAG: ClbS/DfsB family four-helix bundle protein [Flavobacteriales bacterium]|nr:ClbS/DfsB family four-helix bundle protein [Flavobacteriales bacterium]